MIVMNQWSIILVDGTTGFNSLVSYKIDTESITETEDDGSTTQTPIYNLAAFSDVDSTGTSLYALQLKDQDVLRIVQIGEMK